MIEFNLILSNCEKLRSFSQTFEGVSGKNLIHYLNMAGPEMKASILKDLVAVANLDIKCMQIPTVSVMSQTWNLIWILGWISMFDFFSFIVPCYFFTFVWILAPNTTAIYTRRVARQYEICWLKKELSMVHGTLNILFRNKTVLFVKIEIWNFQLLFDLGFHEISRQTFRQHFPG